MQHMGYIIIIIIIIKINAYARKQQHMFSTLKNVYIDNILQMLSA